MAFRVRYNYISEHLLDLTQKYKIEEIWLFGSGVYNPHPKDWDLLIFTDPCVYDSIQEEGIPREIKKTVDLFILKEMGVYEKIFQKPWLNNTGKYHRLCLSDMDWQEEADGKTATYKELIKNARNKERRRAKAIRLWP